jgi:RES domain
VLYRIHRCDRSPWWFSSDGSGRFDLLDGRGTCYLAEQPVGAFVEVFRRDAVIPEAEVAVRCLAELELGASLADCTVEAARAFGVTAALHSQPEYDLTRTWAQAFADAGFGGLRYRLAHDPSAQQLGVAVFGEAGEGSAPIRATEPIAPELVEEARVRFGLLVLPTPA